MIFLGSLISVIGIVLSFSIKNNYGVSPVQNNAKSICTLTLMVMPLFFLIMMCYGSFSGMPQLNLQMKFYGIDTALAIGALIGVLLLKFAVEPSIRKAVEQQAEKTHKMKLVSFMQECHNNGVYAYSSQKEKQKASLIAQRYGLSTTDLAGMFKQADAVHTQNQVQKQQDHLRVVKQEERNAHAALEYYASRRGRDKRIAILTDQLQLLQHEAGQLANQSAMLAASTQQRQHDWAIAAGVANGLGGTAAAVGTAIDIGVKNAQIRAENAAQLDRMMPMLLNNASQVDRIKGRESTIRRQLQEARTKLVADDQPSTCLERLSLTNVTVSVSETGTCTVKTDVILKESFFIFDDVPAVIDGTIEARIFELAGNREIGKAYLVLPIMGISPDETAHLTGMSLFAGTPGFEYTVRFTASNLWAMER